MIGLDNLGIPALRIMSNRITEAQVDKLAHWSQQLANGKITLLFDCEPTGDDEAKEALWLLSQRDVNTRLGWSQAMTAERSGDVSRKISLRGMGDGNRPTLMEVTSVAILTRQAMRHVFVSVSGES